MKLRSDFAVAVATPLLVLVVLLVAGSTARADEIGILYALDADWRALKGDDTSSAHSIDGTTVQTAKIGPHTVRAVQMGAGNVETAINASRLLAKFPCDWVVSLGPAGSLRDDLPEAPVYLVGDVVGYQRGTWSAQGWSSAAAARIALSFSPTPPPDNGFWSEAPRIKLASGDAFVASRRERERIQAETGADLIDMNSYGAALACEKSKVPLLVLKLRSDAADDSAAEDFKKFIAAYQGDLGRDVRKWIQSLPVSPDSPQAYDEIQRLLK